VEATRILGKLYRDKIFNISAAMEHCEISRGPGEGGGELNFQFSLLNIGIHVP